MTNAGRCLIVLTSMGYVDLAVTPVILDLIARKVCDVLYTSTVTYQRHWPIWVCTERLWLVKSFIKWIKRKCSAISLFLMNASNHFLYFYHVLLLSFSLSHWLHVQSVQNTLFQRIDVNEVIFIKSLYRLRFLWLPWILL